MAKDSYDVTSKTKLKRVPKRAVYAKDDIYSILDAAFLCHAGFIHDGMPVVIPTLFGRDGDSVYIHGSSISRMLVELEKEGVELCLNVTLVDGLVLARSAYHHSMNYRSVVIFGKAKIIEDENEKIKALNVVSDHVIKHRWEEARKPNQNELKGTKVFKIELKEVSAKIRTGPPVDENVDYGLDIWAGVIPLKVVVGKAIPDPLLKDGIDLPKSVIQYNSTS